MHALRIRTPMVLLDVLAAAGALHIASWIRFDGDVPPKYVAIRNAAIPVLIGARLLTLLAARLHRWSFRMSGMSEAVRVVLAQMAGTGVFILATFGLAIAVPRSIYALEFFISTTLVGALRFAPGVAMTWYGELARIRAGATRTIIVGAGQAGELLARDIRRNAHSKYLLIGFVDDDRTKLGTRFVGKPVLGRLRDLPRLISTHDVSMVMLAIAGLHPARIRELLMVCSSVKARFKIIPRSFDDLRGRLSAARLHDLAPEHLLPRESVAFKHAEIQEAVSGRCALVTGAGGSIGGEIARQLAAHGADALVLVDINENELYLRARRLAEDHPDIAIHAEVADVREATRLRHLGERYRPEYVFHAAAHKHVPLMEDAPEEAIKNNVFGTLNAAEMASECGAERFVLISTDKAVNPTSVMGASKRLAELVVRDLAASSRTRMTAVRFGNVLGSAGSVVPLFNAQIERGGPVTVTHPECTRYFMTIPEAVGLVLIAGLRCEGDLCVLDMGEPIRIVDLARSLITMAGFIPGEEIQIVYTGLRAGEKLCEEVLTEEEEETQVVRDRIRVARGRPPPPELEARLTELRRVADAGETETLLAMVQELVPSYRITPNERLGLASRRRPRVIAHAYPMPKRPDLPHGGAADVFGHFERGP